MKSLLLKRALQHNCLFSYIPCTTKSLQENKQDSSSNESRGINLRNFHAAMKRIFNEWDEAACWFDRNLQQICLGGTTASRKIVPLVLFFVGGHKSQLLLYCNFSGSVCSQCKNAPPWAAAADNHNEILGDTVDPCLIRELNIALMRVNKDYEITELSCW